MDWETDSFFVLHSFDNQQEIKYGIEETTTMSPKEVLNLPLVVNKKLTDFSDEIEQDEYLKKCNFFIHHLKHSVLNKLILSRVKYVPVFKDLRQTFLNLCKKYPSAFVYLFQLNGETWLGATPERLASVKNNTLKTMALAGTKAANASRDWTEKEREEHQLVVDFIRSTLHHLSTQIMPTETVKLNQLEHLKTEISASLPAGTSFLEIVKKLHPTPAVCGLPQQEALHFILENEGYSRSFYTGFLGFTDNKGADLFVNLRCAQIFSNITKLYVGGGITAKSKALDEWEETELKAKTLI